MKKILRTMIRRLPNNVLFLILITSLIAGCRSYLPMANRNLADLYVNDEGALHPDFQVVNITDSLSRLYFKINSRDLLYTSENGREFTAQLRLSYVLHPGFDSRTIVDSSSQTFISTGNADDNKDVAGYIDIDANRQSYYIEVTLRDITKRQQVKTFFPFDKSSRQAPEYFRVSPRQDSVPLFKNILDSSETFRIRYYNRQEPTIRVAYYNKNFGMAPPPFASAIKTDYHFLPDSVFSIANSDTMQLRKKGVYVFSTDTGKGGICLYRFYDGYPAVNSTEMLLAPMRYLTTKNEYTEIASAPDLKKAIDKFWIDKAGSEMRARELIRKFYKRVESANSLFAAHCEGWKTDRGMLYIVFGPPAHVYKAPGYETWIYGSDTPNNSLEFTFRRTANPLSTEDFQLDRGSQFQPTWYSAVDSWRSGRVFGDR